jgi:hypothetical protein
MEGSLVAYKVFTNGSTLQGSELNENLMQQATAVFSNAAARTAAITSPVEGQVTFLEDLNVISIYDGSSWKNSLRPTGGILQVVTGTTSTEVSTTSGTYVTTGLSATITPTSTSSQILVIANTTGLTPNNSTTGTWTLFRGTVAGTNLGSASAGMIWIYTTAAATLRGSVACSALDSPNTASAQTYTLGFRTNSSGGSITSNTADVKATMILMEVAA